MLPKAQERLGKGAITIGRKLGCMHAALQSCCGAVLLQLIHMQQKQQHPHEGQQLQLTG